MSTSAISGSTSQYQPINQQSDFRQDFGQLVASIKSGDLSGAQQAYASLSELQSNGQGPAASPNSPFAQALAQIGQSLQNGDIAGAQSALQSLKQAQGGHHHHHHGGSAPASTPLSGTSTAATNSPPVSGAGTINIVA